MVDAQFPVPGPLPAAAPPVEASMRDSFDTSADLDIELDQTARGTSMDEALHAAAPPPPRVTYGSAPSAGELLERAAALGPARMTWESIVLPDDPILDEKRLPRVVERRARLTRVVKITLGACLGLCVLAVGVSALSGDPSSKSDASAAIEKSVPSKGIVSVESLDGAKRGKLNRRVAPAATTAAIVRPKHR